MQALSALTPPLLVCAVVIIAIVAFLRHEMSRSRADRTDRSPTVDKGEIPVLPSSPDPDKEQGKLGDAARASANDSGSASRSLGHAPGPMHSPGPSDR